MITINKNSSASQMIKLENVYGVPGDIFVSENNIYYLYLKPQTFMTVNSDGKFGSIVDMIFNENDHEIFSGTKVRHLKNSSFTITLNIP